MRGGDAPAMNPAMRRALILASSLVLAACATTPRPEQAGEQQTAPVAAHVRGAVIGLTAAELVQRFGTPALQIREGASLKLQFRSAQCVLDAYLYQTGTTPHRVTYVDARTRALADVDQAFCIRSLSAP